MIDKKVLLKSPSNDLYLLFSILIEYGSYQVDSISLWKLNRSTNE